MDILFWYFLIYSFFGFLLELLFARLSHSAKRDRKCHLLLPICPVYGLGALAILSLPQGVKGNSLLLYLFGGACATATEWVLAVFYEKAAHVSFWDYNKLPLNLSGRVCVWFSLFWGLLALPLVYRLHPLIMAAVQRIPTALTLPMFTFWLADGLVSLQILRHQGTEGLRWYLQFKPTEDR